MMLKFNERVDLINWCHANLTTEEKKSISRFGKPTEVDNRMKRIWVFDKDRNPVGDYQSATVTARVLGIPASSVVGFYARERIIYKGKYFFSLTPEIPENARFARKKYGV